MQNRSKKFKSFQEDNMKRRKTATKWSDEKKRAQSRKKKEYWRKMKEKSKNQLSSWGPQLA